MDSCLRVLPATTFCGGADELEDDRESVAQRDGRGPPGAAYLHEVDGEWREVSWAEAAERSTSWRTACSRSACEGAALRDPRPDLARMGALRLRARARRRGRGADLRQQLRPRHAVRARALGSGRRARRGRRAAREGRRADARARLAFAELDELRARGRAYAQAHPTALDERADSIEEDDSSRSSTRRGRPGRPRPA